MRSRPGAFLRLLLGAILGCALTEPTRTAPAAEAYESAIEADWLRQAEAWHPRPSPTQGDAAGAVDGVKDGKYASKLPLPTGAEAVTGEAVRHFIDRGRRLAADLREAGVDPGMSVHAFDQAEAELACLPGAAASDDPTRSRPVAAPTGESLRDLYLRVRWAMRRLAFRNPVLNFDRLLLVKRFGQETYPDVCLNHMPWVSRPGGDLCALTLNGPATAPGIAPLLRGALGPGHVHGVDLSWDGDSLPHTLDDGTIGYVRWEYHERSWAFIQSLWTIRPDGTQADAVFKQHFVNPWAVEDTRSIPGTGNTRLVSIAAGHHTLPAGPVVLLTPGVGINDERGLRLVTPDVLPPEGGMSGRPVPEGGVRDRGGFYMHPWPLSEKTFLASYTYGRGRTGPGSKVDTNGYALYLIDVFGTKELLYRDPAISCFSPIPLRPRPRPPILPDRTVPEARYATGVVSLVHCGCDGIPPGRIRWLRLAEPIGWPYDNANGGQRYGEDHRYGGPGADQRNLLNWTPVRILGDVRVREDGSAMFRVPADTAVCFQVLDENRMELRRMRSFVSFQPGEQRACTGKPSPPRPRPGANPSQPGNLARTRPSSAACLPSETAALAREPLPGSGGLASAAISLPAPAPTSPRLPARVPAPTFPSPGTWPEPAPAPRPASRAKQRLSPESRYPVAADWRPPPFLSPPRPRQALSSPPASRRQAHPAREPGRNPPQLRGLPPERNSGSRQRAATR